MKEAQEERYEEGTEIYYTFKLTEEVKVSVDWEVEEDTTYPEGADKEARDRLERAGLPRDLESVEF